MKQKGNNRLAFVFCLVLAAITWVYVMNTVNPMVTREYRPIPVTLLNLEDITNQGMVVMEPQQPMISVTLQGLRNTLNRVSANQIIAEVDLRGYSEGLTRAPINIRQPAETSVYAASSRDLLLNIEQMVERTLDVDVRFDENAMLQDFKYTQTVEPQTVTFRAPRSLANRVHQAQVHVDTSGQRESFTTNERIELVDADGQIVQGIDLPTETATVSVGVKRLKVVPIVISHTGTLPEGVTMLSERIDPNTVRIQGPDELVQNLESIRTEAIDYSELTTSGQRTVTLQFPDGIAEDEPIDPVYTYTVRTPVEQSFIIGRSAIEMRDTEEGLISRIGEGSPVIIRLTGEEGAVDALEENQVKLYVDLSGLEEGTHNVQVQMEPIEGLRFDESLLPTVPVFLSDSDTETTE